MNWYAEAEKEMRIKHENNYLQLMRKGIAIHEERFIDNSYNFANDVNFASKMKFYYSERPRRSGRTRLMAQILVETAIETGERIYINDDHQYIHNTSRKFNQSLYIQIQQIISEYNRKGCQLDCRQSGRESSLDMNIEIRCGNPKIYHEIRIKDYVPTHYVAGFDPYKIEDKQELLLICNIT